MDPDAVLKRFNEALASGDRAEVSETAEALSGWLGTGGFPPDAEVLGWRGSLSREQLVCYFRDCWSIAAMGDDVVCVE